MPFFKLTTPCLVQKRLSNDLFGTPSFGAPKKIMCSVVKFDSAQQKTTIRTDSGATRGHARETVANLLILVDPDAQIALDDVVTVNGTLFRVFGVNPQYSVLGKIDHKEVLGQIE